MYVFTLLFFAAWALIVYTYCVFPLFIALFSHFGGTHAPVTNEWAGDDIPRVAIVVAAHNEEDFIAAKIHNTWQIDYPEDRLTLLIGSDGSSDATAEILRAALDPRLQAHIFENRRGKVSVVNDLMAKVDAGIVVLSDANTMLAADSVRKLIRHFQNSTVGCVNGALELEHNGGVSGEGLYWKYELWIKTNESRLGFVIGCYGGILAIRRALYQPLPVTTIVEDFVLTMRIMEQGWIVRFDPEARAMEPASASSRAEWERKVRIGAGDYQALAMTRQMLHPRYGLRAFSFFSHKVLRWSVPLFLIVAFFSNAAIVGLHWAGHHRFLTADLFVWSLAAQCAGILLSGFVYRLPDGAKASAWTRPITFFYLMNFGLLCGFIRWARGRQPVTWKQAARQASGEAL